MKLQRPVLVTLALLLFLSFFMTWINIDLGFYSLKVSGASLPGKLHQLAAMGEAMSNAYSGESSHSSGVAVLFYVLYLIPLAAAWLAYHVWTGRGARMTVKVHAVLTGLLSLLIAGALGMLFVQALGSDMTALLTGNGYGLTLLLSLGLIVVPLFLKADATVHVSPEQQARVREQGERALNQTGDWLKTQQSKVKDRLEERRIQEALGRTLNRDVLLPNDQVLAPRGSLVTHDLINRARDSGVLSLLLGSIEGAGQVTR